MDALPHSIAQALCGERVAFVIRGWPGLGRVMQGYAMSQLMRSIAPNQRQTFFSSESGLAFLESSGCEVFDIATGQMGSLLLGAVGSSQVYSLLEILTAMPPSAIVVDGELQLMPVLRAVFQGPIVALANAFDLYNPHHSAGERIAFQAYYNSCDFVVIGSFCRPRLEESLKGFPQMVWVQPLVRTELGIAKETSAVVEVAVVLGGGTHGAPSLLSANKRIMDGVYELASRHPTWQFYVFAFGTEAQKGSLPNIAFASTEQCLKAIATCRLVIARSGRNLVAEVLALQKPAILVPADGNGTESDIHRALEQAENALWAETVSTVVYVWQETFDELDRAATQLLNAAIPSVTWKPGNDDLVRFIRKGLG